METFYKLRHKPTGLFFKPATDYPKNSLNKTGKVYAKKPTINALGEHIWTIDSRGKSHLSQLIKSDWEIVCFQTVEVSREDCRG